ncbi:hypothetical protein ACFE04_008341 [Oxalis oulophora]
MGRKLLPPPLLSHQIVRHRVGKSVFWTMLYSRTTIHNAFLRDGSNFPTADMHHHITSLHSHIRYSFHTVLNKFGVLNNQLHPRRSRGQKHRPTKISCLSGRAEQNQNSQSTRPSATSQWPQSIPNLPGIAIQLVPAIHGGCSACCSSSFSTSAPSSSQPGSSPLNLSTSSLSFHGVYGLAGLR